MLCHQALMCPAPTFSQHGAQSGISCLPPLLAPSPLLIGFLAGVPKQDKQEKLAWWGVGKVGGNIGFYLATGL